MVYRKVSPIFMVYERFSLPFLSSGVPALMGTPGLESEIRTPHGDTQIDEKIL